MGIWFDLILIAVLLVSVIIGYVKGLFSVVKRFRLILTVFLAWQLKLISPVKAVVGKICKIDKDYLYEKVQVEFGQKLSENIHNAALSDSEKYDAVFGKLGGLLSGFKEYFMTRITETADNLIADITVYVTNAIYDLIFGAIGFCILFVFFFILFTVLYHIINKILDTGVLGTVNHTLGGVLGAVTGLIWMWLLAIIFVKFGPFIFSTDAETIAGGIGIVRWFVTKFFLSGIFGVTL